MDPINGIGLEKYAELCAKMQDVFNDTEACAEIAKAEGIPRRIWDEVHTGWQERMTDPADMGRTAAMFEPLWQKALDNIKQGNKK